MSIKLIGCAKKILLPFIHNQTINPINEIAVLKLKIPQKRWTKRSVQVGF